MKILLRIKYNKRNIFNEPKNIKKNLLNFLLNLIKFIEENVIVAK